MYLTALLNFSVGKNVVQITEVLRSHLSLWEVGVTIEIIIPGQGKRRKKEKG